MTLRPTTEDLEALALKEAAAREAVEDAVTALIAAGIPDELLERVRAWFHQQTHLFGEESCNICRDQARVLRDARYRDEFLPLWAPLVAADHRAQMKELRAAVTRLAEMNAFDMTREQSLVLYRDEAGGRVRYEAFMALLRLAATLHLIPGSSANVSCITVTPTPTPRTPPEDALCFTITAECGATHPPARTNMITFEQLLEALR